MKKRYGVKIEAESADISRGRWVVTIIVNGKEFKSRDYTYYEDALDNALKQASMHFLPNQYFFEYWKED